MRLLSNPPRCICQIQHWEAEDVRRRRSDSAESKAGTETNAIIVRVAEPMDDEMTKLLERRGELQGAIDAPNGRALAWPLEIAADAYACHPFNACLDATPAAGRSR